MSGRAGHLQFQQVYALGGVPGSVVARIETELDCKVRVLRADDPIALAELLDRWQAAMP